MTFFVDKELVASCLGLGAKYFCASVVFSSENDFSPAAGEMHKYFLDGKISGRDGLRRGGKFFRGRNAGEKIRRRETGDRNNHASRLSLAEEGRPHGAGWSVIVAALESRLGGTKAWPREATLSLRSNAATRQDTGIGEQRPCKD